ncbi:DEAD/DEAH box helicase family protein [Campylobacterota bacterium]
MLKDLPFEITYNTSDNNIAKDFNQVALANSTEYLRGVGYFTSGWLQKNAEGLAEFIQLGGKIKFITSPNIDKNDLAALQGNYDQDTFDQYILKNLDEIEHNLQSNTRNLLGWLVHDGLLEFKFAIPTQELEGGEFHDKFGIFIDEEKNYIAFNGSQNDSIKANKNYESISVFKSWGDETSRTLAKDTLNRFNKLWAEKDSNLKIYPVSEIVHQKLYKLRTYERPYEKSTGSNKSNTNTGPKKIVPRDYQKEAYEKWKENNFTGVLSMATGTGKTITAFNALINLLEQEKHLATVVVVPYQHLVTQWAEEAQDFGIDFIMCFESSDKWSKPLLEAVTRYKLQEQKKLFIITTTSTYVLPKFQDPISKLHNLCLIVDEAHNFGAPNIRKKYLKNATFKLGLSATPERHMDEEGTNAIFEYLGNIIYELSLEKAIKMKMLTEYKYFPILVHLTQDEQEEYIVLSKQIAQLSSFNDGQHDDKIKILAMKRARIIAAAKNKLPALKDTLLKYKLQHSFYNLYYCAAKTTGEDNNSIRMIDDVHDLVESLGQHVENFTAIDSASKEDRKELTLQLKKQIINGLVAIRCLDEGVDIPDVRRAFILASSSNPKEFIQRRGRVLRRAENKEFAEIYDFLVVPSGYCNDEEYKVNQKYLEKELLRYREFAKPALNYPECEKELIEIMREYHLLHI